MITMLEKTSSDTVKAIQVALTPQESEVVIAALARGKLRLILLQEKEGKPLFLPSFGQIEVIRGTNDQRASSYGGTMRKNQSTSSSKNGDTEKSQGSDNSITTPLAAIGNAMKTTMTKTTEQATEQTDAP